MAELLSKLQLSAIILLTALVSGAITGGIAYDKDTTYFCADKGTVMDCNAGMSSTGKTCYFNDADGVKRGKVCYAAWSNLKDVAPELYTIAVEPKLEQIAVASISDCVIHSTGCYDKGFIDRKVSCEVCKK